MLVPEYWAEARLQKRVLGRQVTVKRFGWSDESLAAAQRHAEDRAGEAMARIESGEGLKRREKKIPYNGADGLPIREEIVARHGEVVITRNSYGALCLNTPDVLFADVDFETDLGARSCAAVGGLLLFSAAAFGLYLGSWMVFFFTAVAFGIPIPVLMTVLFRVFDWVTGGGENRAMKRILAFSARNPDWRLCLYRTPAGYRVLALHQTFDLHEAEALGFLRALKSDPIYIQMCMNQRCFRARVSPKPWRIGIEARLKPRPGVWPIKPERMPARLEWVAAYERAARDFASCRFETELGGDVIDPRAEAVRSLHDAYCNARSGLPIA